MRTSKSPPNGPRKGIHMGQLAAGALWLAPQSGARNTEIVHPGRLHHPEHAVPSVTCVTCNRADLPGVRGRQSTARDRKALNAEGVDAAPRAHRSTLIGGSARNRTAKGRKSGSREPTANGPERRGRARVLPLFASSCKLHRVYSFDSARCTHPRRCYTPYRVTNTVLPADERGTHLWYLW